MSSELIKSNHWLDTRLPEFLEEQPNDGLYGCYDVVAKYCGLASVPSLPQGIWVHGWVPQFCQFSPSFMFGKQLSDKERPLRYWPAREDEAEYLKREGFLNTRAIGVPILYTPQRQYQRKPGSLLVMPMHSLEYTIHNWNFDAYADSIDQIRSKFSEVVVCIHPSCWRKGYWIKQFQERDYHIVQGAWLGDLNSLLRMQCLFQSFEYVTTNGLGSHLPYAGYFGAKPSIYGPHAGLQADDFTNDPLYQANPEILEKVVWSYSRSAICELLPHLMREHPAEAQPALEWASHELGADKVLSPKAIRSEFGWSPAQQLIYRLKALLRSFKLLAVHCGRFGVGSGQKVFNK